MQNSNRNKRPRALQACEVCRARKNRCSEDRPCTYCVEHDLECTYSRIPRDKRQRSERVSQVRQVERADSRGLLRGRESESVQREIGLWPNNNNETITPNDLAAPRSRLNVADVAANETSYTSPTTTPGNTASEVMSTNPHTRHLEFYGSSSSVAFLRHVETLSHRSTASPDLRKSDRSLMSLLQNTEFQPGELRSTHAQRDTEHNTDRFHFRVARRFIDAYFSNIHTVHPLFEEEVFLDRCEDLWFDGPGKQPLSFVALYYAVLSIGSLVMPASESLEVSGADRFTWSRKLFQEAQGLMIELGTATDLEMVQCFYIMSKICQHELNPHVSYLYSGQAARTALAIGINRRPVSPDAADPRTSTTASQTWWAVYCLDIQTSFALGRPDSLGPDEYHTQSFPSATLAESPPSPHILQVVPSMVELSRIMRKVALDLYTQRWQMEEKLHRAKMLNAELEYWLQHLPSHLRSEYQGSSHQSLKPSHRANYIKKQSVVLRLRYLNLRMLIHAVFMTDAEMTLSDGTSCLRKCQCQCMRTAEDTIDLMYETFQNDNFFQTWWYNATYTLFAVSTLLAAVFHRLPRTQQGLESHYTHIDRAIEILQAMDECLVVRNAIIIIKRTLSRAKGVPQPALSALKSVSTRQTILDNALRPSTGSEHQPESADFDEQSQPPATVGGLEETVSDIDWLGAYTLDDSQQALFWTEWANELDSLGT